MPVKDMLYDALDFAGQVDESRKSYGHNGSSAGIAINDSGLFLKLTSEEFLSGFRRNDRLMPVITATVYFGDKKWDAPLSLHEMFDCDDPRILKYVPDYRINLIAPADMTDDDFDSKFSTGLGLVFKTIMHSSSNALAMLSDEHRKIDIGSAEFISEVLDVDIDIKKLAKEGMIDMGEATKKYLLERDVRNAIDLMRKLGYSDEDILKKVTEQYDVDESYVNSLLHPAA